MSTLLEKIFINDKAKTFPVAYIIPNTIEDVDAYKITSLIERNEKLLNIITNPQVDNLSEDWRTLWNILSSEPIVQEIQNKYGPGWDQIISFRWSRVKANSLENLEGGSQSETNLYDTQAHRMASQSQDTAIPSFQEWMHSKGMSQAKNLTFVKKPI